jgi:RNA polymerase sigma factor (sigma-70 family)
VLASPPSAHKLAGRLGSSGSYEDIFLANLDLIDGVVRFIARRHRLAPTDADEFASLARLKLIEDDYAALRAFKGNSTLRTYLVTVLNHLFLDDRTARWGRWRPSATAKRLGPTALLLERLTARDGLSEDAAIETVRTNHGVTESVVALRALVERLPGRIPRRPAGDELEDLPDPAPGADAEVLASERAQAGDRIGDSLERALSALESRERLVLRLRFQDALPVNQIAAIVEEDPKRLYRTIEKLVLRLRESMTRDGIHARDVLDVLDHEGLKEDAAVESPRRVSLSR